MNASGPNKCPHLNKPHSVFTRQMPARVFLFVDVSDPVKAIGVEIIEVPHVN